MTLYSDRHPPKLPFYTDLPEDLRPTLARIYSLQSQSCALAKRLMKWESATARLRSEREAVEREAIQEEISLWDTLGKITKLPSGPGCTVAFKCSRVPTTKREKEVPDPEAVALSALRQMSSEEREDLLASLLQLQRAADAKSPSTQESYEEGTI